MQKVMQKEWPYIKNSGNFIKKTNNLNSIPKNVILLTANVVGLCPSIPHEVDLRALREALDKRDERTIPTEGLLKMAEFVLKNNTPFACIFMNDLETKFIEGQHLQHLVWLQYIDYIFFIWAHGEKGLKKFVEERKDFNQYIKFT